MSVKLKLTPQRNALLKGFNNELHALLQLKHVKENDESKVTKSLNLSIVLDRSGSMAGHPLEEAKKAAIMMVNKMRSSDFVSVVAYDSVADLIVPITDCRDKNRI